VGVTLDSDLTQGHGPPRRAAPDGARGAPLLEEPGRGRSPDLVVRLRRASPSTISRHLHQPWVSGEVVLFATARAVRGRADGGASRWFPEPLAGLDAFAASRRLPGPGRSGLRFAAVPLDLENRPHLVAAGRSPA